MQYHYRCITGEVRIPDVNAFLAILKDIADRYEVAIQAMDADLVAGEAHIKSAVQKALRAIHQGTSITNDLSMEVLLYAAGRRQIDKALRMGVSEGDNKRVAIVIIEKDRSRSKGRSKGRNLDSAIASEIKYRLGLDEHPLESLDLSLKYKDKRKRLMQFFGITDAEIKAVGANKLPMLVLERVALLEVYK